MAKGLYDQKPKDAELPKEGPPEHEAVFEIVQANEGACDTLKPAELEVYRRELCSKISVDPTLRPIEFIPTKNGLRPYLTKGAAELIRDARGISVTDITVTQANGMYIVACKLQDRSGRVDTDIGAVPVGSDPANALMKATTKAKRRATLSMCRLGSVVDEAHPSEYGGSREPQEAKANILLEDEATVKYKFKEACQLKTGVTITKDQLNQLLEQAEAACGSKSIDECAKWAAESDLVILIDDAKNACFKEMSNGFSA